MQIDAYRAKPYTTTELIEIIERFKTKESFLRFAKKMYPDPQDFALIKKAYNEVRRGFVGKTRQSGGPVRFHPIAVATLILLHQLTTWTRNVNTVVAGLLHDVIEDLNSWSKKKVQRMFNEVVANLVWAVTKPERLPWQTDLEFEFATFKKVVDGGFQSILIKICDRMHNLLTPVGSYTKRSGKVDWARNYLLPEAIKLGFFAVELKNICENEYRELDLLKQEKNT